MTTRPRQIVRGAVLALGCAVVAAGCAKTGTTPAATTAPAKVRKGGTITVVGAFDPNGFNVKIPERQTDANLDVMASLWRGVWRLTPDGQFVLNSDLVASAEMTNTEPQTVVYKINPQAVWSDGVPVDAEDFIYNWQSARPGATDVDGSPIQSTAPPGGGDPIVSVTGSDDGKTVTVVWKDHNVQWKSGILFNFLIPAHVAKRVGFNTGFDRFDPNVEVSDGPYRIASYNPGRDLTLIRNERYLGPPANLDSIVFRFTTEDAAVGAFKNGEGDLVVGHAVADLVAQLKKLPEVTAKLAPSLSQEYVGFNLRNEFLAIPDVRKAFALALDRRAIVDRAVSGGSGVQVVNSYLWPNSAPEYHDASGGRYDHPDIVAAKRLLEGAGFILGADGVYTKEGKRLSLRGRTFTEAPHDAELELVQAQVKQAGIDLRIDDAPFSVLQAQLQKGDFDVEVSNYGKNQLGTLNQFRAGNHWAYANPQPNQLIVTSNTELDNIRRLALLDQADRMLWDDLPIVPLYQSPLLVAVRGSFANIDPNPFVAWGPFWNTEQWARKAQ